MMKKDGWRVLAVCLLLGLGTIGLYAPVFTFDFVGYDDPLYVVNNPHVNQGLGGAFGWAFQAGNGHAWQPLTWLSHAFDCELFGLKPGWHHATSLLLHALNSVLVFLVLRQLTGAFWRCAAVAAFFAWHPLHVEAAAWISERKGLLCAFFWLLTLWAYTRYAQNMKSQISNFKFYYVGAVVFFALALMSAPLAVTLPLILLLLDWWPLERLAATAERPAAKQALFLLREKIPFFVLSALACLANMLAVHGNQFLDPIARLPFKARFVAAGWSCFRYIFESFWPADLGAVYPMAAIPSKLALIGVAVVLVVITVLALWARKTRPYGLAGWLWFLAALFPVLDLVQTGAQPMADRYMYLPSIGLWMLLGWLAYDLAARLNRGPAVLGGLCALLLAACCALTWMQLGSWKNEGTLLARIPQSKANSFGHVEYAAYLLQHGQLDLAQTECDKAIGIDPTSLRGQLLAGDILLAGHKVDQAIQKFQFVLNLNPAVDLAHQGLGRAYLAQNHIANAAAEFKTAIHNQPKNIEAHNLLAGTLLHQGNVTDAIGEYRASLNLQIDQVEALNNLAWLLATDPHPEIRSGPEAVQLAQRACGLTRGQEPIFLGTLAAAFAEAGDFDRAVKAGKMAHDLALAKGFKALADTNNVLLDLYRAHQPFHEKQ